MFLTRGMKQWLKMTKKEKKQKSDSDQPSQVQSVKSNGANGSSVNVKNNVWHGTQRNGDYIAKTSKFFYWNVLSNKQSGIGGYSNIYYYVGYERENDPQRFYFGTRNFVRFRLEDGVQVQVQVMCIAVPRGLAPIMLGIQEGCEAVESFGMEYFESGRKRIRLD
jgi:hypothetical protein